MKRNLLLVFTLMFTTNMVKDTKLSSNSFVQQIERNAVQVLPIFDLIARTGNIPERDMFNTFNMGVGMVVCVDKNDADKAVSAINESGEKAYILGELVESEEGVIIC